jgi:outer membrane receptor protein involved in Fe transport
MNRSKPLHSPRSMRHRAGILFVGNLIASFASAQGSSDGTLAPVVVQSSRNSVLGEASTANEGVVTQQQLEARTVYRPGEVLEATPGLIVSQHSGEGKANQYYLRGFNLDHGTDLRTTVDGMLVNKRTHAHGQGWTDLNFFIPELATELDYRKGPYYAAEGDFASAGAVSVRYADTLAAGIASFGIGQNGYARTLIANSAKYGNGNVLYALELFHNNGPFVVGDNYRKKNGLLRYSEGNEANGFNVTLMAYDGKWHATDQVPQRAIDQGLIDRFGAIDQTDGGKSSRYSVSTAWRQTGKDSASQINAYVIRDRLDLYSNFTYFLYNADQGDQFYQPDARTTTGINASHTLFGTLNSRSSDTTFGLQFQNDSIKNGLFNTVARQIISTTRSDHISERSVGVFAENKTQWTDRFRTVAGIRADNFNVDVNSDTPANSGTVSATKASPKVNLIFGPFGKTEFYTSAGYGFHSNDARGATVTQVPPNAKGETAGDPLTRSPLLVRSRGIEVGVRTEAITGLQSALSLYRLDFDSELIFQGDAGTTAAGRPSRRIGFEFSNYYKPTKWLTIDADLAFAKARFRDFDPVGDRIPGSIEGVASVSASIDNLGPYYGGLQLRYFGPRPLIEDNSIRSKSTSTLNGRIGYKISRKVRIALEGYNLTNRKDNAIDYYYESRLAGEARTFGGDGLPIGTFDKHPHPIESRSFRVNLTVNF